MLVFKAAKLPANKNVQLGFTLLDNKLGTTYNIQHILSAWLMRIKGFFTETVHSHDGHILMEFVPSTIDLIA